MIFESMLIRPDNWDLDFHRQVAGVLTWHSELLKEPHCARGGFTHLFPKKQTPGVATQLDPAPRTRLCTLIAGNKSVSHPLELYSARRAAIAWFEKNQADDFKYFGVGWERPYLKGGFTTKVLRKLNLLQFLPEAPSPCFGGRIESKFETLRKFDFSICFENAREIPGYISEKIFDSMFAGCIPVYWGAPDIATFLPKETYIDFRNFKSYDDLYVFMKSMPQSELARRRNAIVDFFSSQESAIFDADRATRRTAQSIVGFLT